MPTAATVPHEPANRCIALDLQQQLTKLGYTVVAIADCAELALAAAAQWQPDLALMDIRLRGDKNGIETAVMMREQHNVPIVFLTAHADAATIQQVKTAQPYGYIVKPFETHNLTTSIEVALNKYQSERATQAALEQEKALNQLKSNFIEVVSHEFRNPLSAILLQRLSHGLATVRSRSVCFALTSCSRA